MRPTRSRPRRRARATGAAALTVAAAVTLAPSSTAAAGPDHERAEPATTVVRVLGSTFRPGADTIPIKGTVASSRKRCEMGRLVIIRPAGGGDPVGRDRTDTFGRWRIEIPAAQASPFRFTATAPRSRVRDIRCGRGSDTGTIYLDL